MTRSLKRFVVWSNIFYAAPLLLALRVSFWIDAIALTALIICSTAFHYSREQRFVLADTLASIAVIGVNATACVLGGFRTPYFTAVWLLAVGAFFIRYVIERGDRGSAAHGVWHLTAAIILALCIFVYAGPML